MSRTTSSMERCPASASVALSTSPKSPFWTTGNPLIANSATTKT